MTDEVASLVLGDNYQQTQSLSISEMRAGPWQHQQVMRHGTGWLLDRNLEFLPSDEITERKKPIRV